MRKVLYGSACSLDGFIAGPDDEVDWLQWNDDVAEISRAVWATTDTVVMGRRTYEVAVQNGMPAYPGVQNIVFSKLLRVSGAPPNLRIVDSDAVDFVRELKEAPGADICVVGGGQLARSLFAASLIDEVGMNIHPILLGRGIPMFPPADFHFSLALTEARPLPGGCYYARYRVNR